MEIVYCDACGHRIPDAHFGDGSAKRVDGKAFCAKCPVPAPAPPPPPAPSASGGNAVGAATATMPAASRETATLRTHTSGARRPTQSISKIPSTVRTQQAADSSSLRSAVPSAAPASNKMGIIVIGGAAAAVVALILVVAMSGGDTKPDKSTEKVAATDPEPGKPVEKTSGTRSTPPVIVPIVPALTPTPNANQGDTEAATALANVLKFDGVKPTDLEEKIARVEAFIDKYGAANPNSNAASKAQLLLRDLRQQISERPSTDGPPQVVSTPVKPDLKTPVVAPPPQPTPANPAQPAPPAQPATASIPSPPPVAITESVWKIDLSAADIASHISIGKLVRGTGGLFLKSGASTDPDHHSAIEFETGKGNTAFSISDTMNIVFSYYTTSTEPILVQFWARDGDQFGNIGFFVTSPKANEWTTFNKRMITLVKTKGGKGDPIKPGLGVRNVQFHLGKPSQDIYVDNVMVYEGAVVDDVEPKNAFTNANDGGDKYERFQKEFFTLLRKRDTAGAAARMKSAEDDPFLKNSLAGDRRAMAWLADIETAVAKGAEKLKETENFELKLVEGDPMRVGKGTPTQVTGVSAGALQLSVGGTKVPMPLANLHTQTRSKLAQMGLDWDVNGIIRHNFLFLLMLGVNEEVTVDSVRAAINKAKTNGVPAAECEYQEKILAMIEKDVPEMLAASSFDDLLQMKQNKAAGKAIKTALAAWQKKHGATQFATKKADEIKAMGGLPDGAPPANSTTGAGPALASLTDGLVGYWKFDDGTGAKSVADASGKGNAGKLVQGPAFAAGIVGGAMSFDGGFGLVDIAGPNVSTNALTICCFVRHTALAAKIERYMTFGDESAVLRHDGNGQLTFSIKTDSTKPLSTKGAMAAGQWIHVAGTWDGTTQKLFKDGVMLENQTPGGSIKDASNLKVGGLVVQGFNGLIDEVRIYNRALSAEEIAALAAMGKK